MRKETDQYVADCEAMVTAGARWLASHPGASLADARLLRVLERAATRGGICHASGAQIQIVFSQLRDQTGRS